MSDQQNWGHTLLGNIPSSQHASVVCKHPNRWLGCFSTKSFSLDSKVLDPFLLGILLDKY